MKPEILFDCDECVCSSCVHYGACSHYGDFQSCPGVGFSCGGFDECSYSVEVGDGLLD